MLFLRVVTLCLLGSRGRLENTVCSHHFLLLAAGSSRSCAFFRFANPRKNLGLESLRRGSVRTQALNHPCFPPKLLQILVPAKRQLDGQLKVNEHICSVSASPCRVCHEHGLTESNAHTYSYDPQRCPRPGSLSCPFGSKAAEPPVVHMQGDNAWGLRQEALRCAVLVVSTFGKMMSQKVPAMLLQCWALFKQSLDPYVQYVVLEGEGKGLEGSDLGKTEVSKQCLPALSLSGCILIVEAFCTQYQW